MLENKVILLTGGVDGIGWECAKAYARNGAQLCIADINAQGAIKIKELTGAEHLFVSCNISVEQEVKNLFDTIHKKYGKLDCIHNNAGLANPSKPLHTTTIAEWNLLFDINVKSILLTTTYGIPYLEQAKGCILNTSSLVGTIGQENHAAYVATKGAVNALTKAMALDYAPLKIRVNAISPAAIRTPMLESWSKQQPNATEIQLYLDQLQPLGKMPEGDVVADAAVFLLSESARFITGHILPVSGGAELGYRVSI